MTTREFEGVNVTMADFRQCNCCAKGIRDGFQRYGADYTDFLNNGIDGALLLEITNDNAMVLQVVEVARGRQ